MRDVNFAVDVASGVAGDTPRICALVIDPSNYSLPYDQCLCDALWNQGCDVSLVRSKDIYDTNAGEECFPVRKDFYPHTHARAKEQSRGRFWKLKKAGEHVLCMRRLAAEIAESKPDIVHFQWLPVPLLDRMFLSRLRRTAALVMTLHNTSLFHGEEAYRLQGIGLRSAAKLFDAVIVHTEYSRRNAIEQWQIDEQKIHVVPHGILHSPRGNESGVRPPAGDEQVLLYFGNLKHYKGVDVLIRAFSMLPPETRKATRLCIAGYPSMDVEPLRALAHQLRIEDRIDWDLRFIPQNEIAALFRSATAVVLPYREIDQSGVLLTAIALEKPVVASRVGGVAETIQDGVHGLLTPPGEPAPLADAIRSILADTKLRLSMETALRTLRGELSWDNIAQRTLSIYSTLASTR